jgi:hypothetical protein
MFSGTAQVSHQVCQFFCQFCWVPWDYVIVMLAGKPRKMWNSLSELREVLCVKDDWKGQFWGLRYCLSKLCSLLSFSVRYDVTQFNWECTAPFIMETQSQVYHRHAGPRTPLVANMAVFTARNSRGPRSLTWLQCTFPHTLIPWWRKKYQMSNRIVRDAMCITGIEKT